MQGTLTAKTDHVEGIFMEEDIAGLPPAGSEIFQILRLYRYSENVLFRSGL